MRFRRHAGPRLAFPILADGTLVGGPGSLGIHLATNVDQAVRFAFGTGPCGTALIAPSPWCMHLTMHVVQLGAGLAFSQPPLRKTNLLAICHHGWHLAEPSQRMAVSLSGRLLLADHPLSAPVALAHPLRNTTSRPQSHSRRTPLAGNPLTSGRYLGAPLSGCRPVGNSLALRQRTPCGEPSSLAACHCINFPCGTSTLVTGALRIRHPCGHQDHRRSTIVVHPLRSVNHRGRWCVQ